MIWWKKRLVPQSSFILHDLNPFVSLTSFCWNRQDLSGKFHEFPWVSMRFYAHASHRLQKILIVWFFFSCFQKILCFCHIYNEIESPSYFRIDTLSSSASTPFSVDPLSGFIYAHSFCSPLSDWAVPSGNCQLSRMFVHFQNCNGCASIAELQSHCRTQALGLTKHKLMCNCLMIMI